MNATNEGRRSQGSQLDRKLIGLQWGRATAALTVVVAHAIAHPLPGAPGVIHLMGRFGVALFFVISGYIMVVTTGRDAFQPLDFLRRRLLRVAPLYYIATGVTVVSVLVAPQVFKDTVFDLPFIIKSLLFIPAYRPNMPGLINPFLRLGWTLEYEMFFYVTFACLFAMRAVNRAILLTVCFLGLIVIGQWFPFEDAVPRFYTQIDTLGFAAGVWLGVLMLYDKLRPGYGRSLSILVVVSLFAMALTYHAVKDNPWTQVWLVATCMVLVGILVSEDTAFRRLGSSWMVWVGDASYSMYLFHMFAIGAFTALGRKFLPPQWQMLTTISAALGGIALGLLVYQIVEKPLNRFFRRWAPGPRPNPVGARRAADHPTLRDQQSAGSAIDRADGRPSTLRLNDV